VHRLPGAQLRDIAASLGITERSAAAERVPAAIREFPLLRSLVPALVFYDGATELERGLGLLLSGLTDLLTPRAAPQTGVGPGLAR
jgi:hypothetical protein